METKRNVKKRKPPTKNKKKKKSGTPGATVLIVLLVIAVGLGSILLYMGYQERVDEENRQSIIHSKTMHAGISINNLELGGLTYDEALSKLRAIEAEIAAGISFTFSVEGKSFTADSSYFNISYNTEAILEEAMLLGREGTLFELQAQIEDIRVNGRTYAIAYTVEPDMVKFEALLDSIAEQVNIAPTDASVIVKEIGYSEDTNGKAAVDLSYKQLVAKMGLAEGQTVDQQDLRFDFVEEQAGYGIDVEAALAAVTSHTEDRDFGEIKLSLNTIASEITIDYLKENVVCLRSSSYTSYNSSSMRRDSRVHNMKKASGLIYGTVLQPGETFSTNGTLGDRTERGGWALAPAVIDGGAATEDQYGGGVCQISTTLYNAVLKADLEITYRRNHSSMSAYVDGGLDATIADSTTGNIDFTWTNNTDSPIYVFMWLDTDARTVNCEIYGVPFPDTFDEIQISSALLETIEPTADEFVKNNSLSYPYWAVKNAAKKGYKYETYKTYLKDGVVVKTITVDTSTYRMHPNRYYVWPGYAGEPLYLEYKLDLSTS